MVACSIVLHVFIAHDGIQVASRAKVNRFWIAHQSVAPALPGSVSADAGCRGAFTGAPGDTRRKAIQNGSAGLGKPVSFGKSRLLK
jgi:hypothetical protein